MQICIVSLLEGIRRGKERPDRAHMGEVGVAYARVQCQPCRRRPAAAAVALDPARHTHLEEPWEGRRGRCGGGDASPGQKLKAPARAHAVGSAEEGHGKGSRAR
jgi:hypothetical protein